VFFLIIFGMGTAFINLSVEEQHSLIESVEYIDEISITMNNAAKASLLSR
jgi:hypothetical protein